MTTINIKKTITNAVTPTRGSTLAAGWDLYSTEQYILKPMERHLFKTGIVFAIPSGLYGRIAPRSGIAFKDGIDVMAGVIDADYRDDIGVLLINLGSSDKTIVPGDRIAQIIFENCAAVEFNETEDLSATKRGIGGFGSTDFTPAMPNIISISANKITTPMITPNTNQIGDKLNSVEARDAFLKKYESDHKGKTMLEQYGKSGGVEIKKRYSDEIKERTAT